MLVIFSSVLALKDCEIQDIKRRTIVSKRTMIMGRVFNHLLLSGGCGGLMIVGYLFC